MTNEKLSFQSVMGDKLRNKIINLDGSKATPNVDIPIIGDLSMF